MRLIADKVASITVPLEGLALVPRVGLALCLSPARGTVLTRPIKLHTSIRPCFLGHISSMIFIWYKYFKLFILLGVMNE